MNFLPVEIDQEYIGIAEAFGEFCANDPTLAAIERDRPDDKKDLRAFEKWHEANCEAYNEAHESAMRRFAVPLASSELCAVVVILKDLSPVKIGVNSEYFRKSAHLLTLVTGKLAGFVLDFHEDKNFDPRVLDRPVCIRRDDWENFKARLWGSVSEKGRESRARKRDTSDDAMLGNRIEGVIAAAKRGWPDATKRPPIKAIARELERSHGENLKYKRETIGKILRGTYPPAKRLKIGGL